LFPGVNRATIALLVRAGYRVLVPQAEVCCGAILAHLGRDQESKSLARRNVNVFTRAGVDFVVTNAAGCGAHLRDYGRHLAGDAAFAEAAAGIAGKVRDVTEVLAAAGLPPPTTEVRARVAYHDACHLVHGQGVRAEPRALLRSIPGLELVEIAESEICCGSAGTYNLTEPEMAWRLAERKTRNVLATAPDMVAAGNPGCILQIRAGLRLAGREIPVVHPVELLARAHGLSSS
ncbi:MAG: (Fe-S)-binding protein, partial [Candidatus Binatia bacterium]